MVVEVVIIVVVVVFGPHPLGGVAKTNLKVSFSMETKRTEFHRKTKVSEVFGSDGHH